MRTRLSGSSTLCGETCQSARFRHDIPAAEGTSSARRWGYWQTDPVPVIEVRNLTKRFGSVLAVDDLSFNVEAGSITGFLGPNGAGKTTTLRSLLGLVTPTHGTAL